MWTRLGAVRALRCAALLAAACGALACGAGRGTSATGADASNAEDEACLALAGAPRKAPAADAARIGVRHVLVKWAGARKPAPGIARARGEACRRAVEARDAIVGGALDFDAAVAKFSDEPGAASRNGLVGAVVPGEVDPAFAGAAFELERGQMSDVVESPSGFHLILRFE
jgi:NIMA-interacting peptidyl-prolyl cis-trans isomerase 1